MADNATISIGVLIDQANIKTQLNSLKNSIQSSINSATSSAKANQGITNSIKQQSLAMKNIESLYQRQNKEALSLLFTGDKAMQQERNKQAMLQQQIATHEKIRALMEQSANKSALKSMFPEPKAATQTVAQFQEIQGEAKKLIDIQKALGKSSPTYQAQVANLKQLGKQYGFTTTQIQRTIKAQKRFSFDFLTLMFAGMMLQRVFGGALRNIIDSYKKMTGMQSEFNRATLKLAAGWNYVKFSIANALNNPMVINAIEWLVDMFERMADWIQENQSLTLLLLGTMAALAALGGFAVLLSGLKQLGMMMGVLNTNGELATESIKAAGKALRGMVLNHPLLALITALLLLGAAALATYPTLVDDVKKGWTNGVVPAMESGIKTILDMFGISVDVKDVWKYIAFLFSKVVLLGEALIVMLVDGAVGLFAVFTTLGKFIWQAVVGTFQSAMVYLNEFLKLLNKIPGIDFEVDERSMKEQLESVGQGWKDTFDGIKDDWDSVDLHLDQSMKSYDIIGEQFYKSFEDVKSEMDAAEQASKQTADSINTNLQSIQKPTSYLDDIINPKQPMSEWIQGMGEDGQSKLLGTEFDNLVAQQEELSKQSLAFSESMKTGYEDNIAPAMTGFDESLLTAGDDMQTEVLDKWEGWKPTEKNLTLNVTKVIRTVHA